MLDGLPTAYEVLGVSPAAGHDDIRRAYRRLLRETHPDLGGSSARFHAVQRAWAAIETPERRRSYDLRLPASLRRETRPATSAPNPAHAKTAPTGPPSGAAASPFSTSSAPGAPRSPVPDAPAPRALSYGHPGGEARSTFFRLMREWAGRGSTVQDPYDPLLLRSAPREIRQWLAKAQAEEATATIVSSLGPVFAIWNDVMVGSDGILDHVVVGPGGLYAIDSEDWGTPVTLERGEIQSTRLEPGETPVKWFARRAKSLARSTGMKFAGLLVVVPDSALATPMALADRRRAGSTVVVRRQMLPAILSAGAPEWGLVPVRSWGVDQVFETRDQLQRRLRLA